MAEALRALGSAIVSAPSWLVGIVTVFLGNWALWQYAVDQLTLLPVDATSRLDTARRVVDSLTPSFTQLGGVWLPLPQLLMLATVWHDGMWQTGLAGSGISVLAFGIASGYVHRTVRALTGCGLTALLCATLLATNANLLYMQATPMTEALTIALIAGATFHLVEWARSRAIIHLLGSSVMVFLGTLTRYEMWVLLPAGACVVAITELCRNRSLRRAEGLTLAWTVLASYGIVLWVVYNRVIFGSFTNFSSGTGSAKAFAEAAAAAGQLPTKHNLLESVAVYGTATLFNLGLPCLIAAVAGGIALLAGRQPLPVKVAALLPTSIFVFEVVSLFAGQSLMWVPSRAPHAFYNVRYGLLMLPAAVVLAGGLAGSFRRGGTVLLLAAVLPQLAALPELTGARTVVAHLERADADRGAFLRNWVPTNLPRLRGDQQMALMDAAWVRQLDIKEIKETATWLRRNATEGKILISAQANDPLMFHAGLPLSTYIYEGNSPYFAQEMEVPGIHADWLVVGVQRQHDALQALFANGKTPRGFELVYENAHFRVYGRIGRGVEVAGITTETGRAAAGPKTLLNGPLPALLERMRAGA